MAKMLITERLVEEPRQTHSLDPFGEGNASSLQIDVDPSFAHRYEQWQLETAFMRAKLAEMHKAAARQSVDPVSTSIERLLILGSFVPVVVPVLGTKSGILTG